MFLNLVLLKVSRWQQYSKYLGPVLHAFNPYKMQMLYANFPKGHVHDWPLFILKIMLNYGNISLAS